MTTLLGDSSGLGYGVPAGRPVMTFVDEVAGMEVEWTLGVALSLVDPALLMRKVRQLTRPAEREREREWRWSGRWAWRSRSLTPRC